MPKIPQMHLHDNEDGSISIIAVFAMMLFTMLLGMIINIGRHVNDKIQLQNAADSATYSGGIMLARGMNTLVFTNHLLCEMFATVAYFREARDQNAASYVPTILAAWDQEGPVFADSGFTKFQSLGSAITQKIPLEQELVHSYSQWAAAAGENILPLLEEILSQEMIPEYQRAVVAAFPDVAQAAATDIANRYAASGSDRGTIFATLWRNPGRQVGGTQEELNPTLPVVDPSSDVNSVYLPTARQQRSDYANHYLTLWNDKSLVVFDKKAKMSQFSKLWRSFTCGQLNKLLNEEYPTQNLPMLIHTAGEDVQDGNSHLNQFFSFVGVAYWKKPSAALPGLFVDPSSSDRIAYAQVQIFVPTARIAWERITTPENDIGGVPADFPDVLDALATSTATEETWAIRRQSTPQEWNLWSQVWTCQLTPTTQTALPTILRTDPQLSGISGNSFSLPDLSNLGTEEIGKISPH